MNPGEELDALIAEKVMGVEKRLIDSYFAPGWKAMLYKLPNYSTSIEASWDVVEKIKCRDRHMFHIDHSDGEWFCGFEEFNTDMPDYSKSDTAPHAICLAALKAVDVQI